MLGLQAKEAGTLAKRLGPGAKEVGAATLPADQKADHLRDALLPHPTTRDGCFWCTEVTLATGSTAPSAKLLSFGAQLPPVSNEYLVIGGF